MNDRRRGLGRGLGSLIPTAPEGTAPSSTGALAYREAAREIVERYAAVPGPRTLGAETDNQQQSNPLPPSNSTDGGSFHEVAR